MCKKFKTFFHGKRKNQNEDKCPHQEFADCPYNRRSECPNIKKDCYLPEDEDTQTKDTSKYKGTFLFIISIILIIASLGLKEFIPNLCHYWNVVFEVTLSIGASLFAGVVLAWLINLPQNLEDFTQIVTTSLSSFKYLSTLTREQLISLRNKVTYELHTKKLPYMPQGLLKLDKKVCDLLENPYYRNYREIIQCHKKGDYKDIAFIDKDKQEPTSTNITGQFYWKEVTQEYTIKNPYDKQRQIKANIGISNHIYLPKDCDIKNIYEIESYQLSIDDKPFIDITPFLKVVYNNHSCDSSNLDPDTITYNTGLFLSTIDEKTITSDYLKTAIASKTIEYSPLDVRDKSKVDLLVLFSDKVVVKFRYKQVIPEADNHFTKRLKYSTKSYRLDYFCDDDEIQLFGQLFGTLIDQSQIAINKSKDGKHISVEAFEWLLPKSGAFVAMGGK